MSLAEVSRRKIIYENEVRRQFRESRFRQLRQDATLSFQVNQEWLAFLKEQPAQVPLLCVQNYRYIQDELLNPFFELIMNNELQLVDRHPKINGWYWDSVAVTNLRFMTQFCHSDTQYLLAGYFKSTFDAYRPFLDLYTDIQNKIKYSGCYVNLLSLDELSEADVSSRRMMEFMESDKGIKAIAALLDFWGAYLLTSTELILMQEFTMMFKLFDLFSQYSRIFYERQTFRFLTSIFRYIEKMQGFLQFKGRLEALAVVADCDSFINHFRKRLPGIFSKQKGYNIYYHELGSLLLSFEVLNKSKPGIFFQTIFQIDLTGYVIGLLKKQKEEDDYSNSILTAMRLINHFNSNQNFYQVFYLDGAINITRILAHKLLQEPKVQRYTAIVLYNIVIEDRDDCFLKIFELVDYQAVLDCMQQDSEVDIFEFLIKVLEIYWENQFIYDKLLVQCHLEQTMREFYLHEEQKKGYAQLAKLVMRNLQFFMRNYRKTVLQIWHNAEAMTFEGQDAFVTKVLEFEHMRESLMTL